MKKILLTISLAIMMVLVSSLAVAAGSRSVSYRLSLTLPEHPRILAEAQIEKIDLLAQNSPYLLQESEHFRNDQLVLLRSFTIK